MNVFKLIEKLKQIEALYDGTTFDGEREPAPQPAASMFLPACAH